MSNEEMDAAILRLVKDRTECRRRRAALAAELTAAAHVLQSLAQALTYLDRESVKTADPVALIDQHADLLEPSKLARLIREHAEVSKRIEEMDRQAHEIGID